MCIQMYLHSSPPELDRATKDYRELRDSLKIVANILDSSGAEQALVRDYREQIIKNFQKANVDPSKCQLEKISAIAFFAIRCTILRRFLKQDYRTFSILASGHPLFQWFIRRGQFEGFIAKLSGKWLSKSSLERFDKVLPAENVSKVIGMLCSAVSGAEWQKHLPDCPEPLSIRDIWVDSTCLEVDMHYPVDWVLFRDAVRTLVKAIICLRKHGLKHRIREPRTFLTAINKASIEMAAVLRGQKAKLLRKRVFRKMKVIVNLVTEHAKRYRAILERERAKRTDLTEAEAAQIKERIDSVLQQLPAAFKQATDRIIQNHQVSDTEKVLSLYEADAHVIVRGKAGAKVEFGNKLYIAESRDGLIVDFELFKDRSPADSAMLKESISRMRRTYGGLSSITADRGFDSPDNRTLLKDHQIIDRILPKSPKKLADAFADPDFRAAQKRRAQTEARIAILKNGFIGDRLAGKGFEHQLIEVTWYILAHNLWVIGRVARQAARKRSLQQDRKKAS